MLKAPATWEWFWVYAPMAAVLLFACTAELLEDRIPNWLSLLTVCYFLFVRLAHRPAEIGLFLISLFLAVVVLIGLGWGRGYLGGGVAKLGAAICAGLPLRMATFIACGLLLVAFLIVKTQRWHGVERIPGSVVLALFVVVTLIVYQFSGTRT